MILVRFMLFSSLVFSDLDLYLIALATVNRKATISFSKNGDQKSGVCRVIG